MTLEPMIVKPEPGEVALIVNRSLARTLAYCDSDNKTLYALGHEARRALGPVDAGEPTEGDEQ